MNPMTDMFDFSKSFEQFSKFQPDFANASPAESLHDMAAKYRAVTIEAMNKNVELTTAWMQDAAKDASDPDDLGSPADRLREKSRRSCPGCDAGHPGPPLRLR
jgi:hypothetical protein